MSLNSNEFLFGEVDWVGDWVTALGTDSETKDRFYRSFRDAFVHNLIPSSWRNTPSLAVYLPPPHLPESLKIFDDDFVLMLVLLASAYLFLHAAFTRYLCARDGRRLAWVLSLLIALFATSVSIPPTVQALRMILYPERKPWDVLPFLVDVPSSLWMCKAYLAFVILDITFGALHYPKQFLFLTGWVHHIFYGSLMVFCVNYGITRFFALYCFDELPTLILALGHMGVRSDILFGSTFFFFRVFLHAVITFYALFVTPASSWKANPTEFWIFVIPSCLALLLHLHWFYGWSSNTGRKLFRSIFGSK